MGLSKKADIEALHAQVQKDLEAVGARLDQIEACFAPPGIPNRRRKPRPGMLVDGAKALGTRGYPVEKDKAFMVGDQVRDAMAAKRYGIPCIVLATTRGSTALRERLDVAGLEDVDIEEDLAAAVDKILRKVNA